MGGGGHPPVSRLAQSPCSGDVTGFGGDPGERVEGEHFDGGVAAEPGIVEDRDETIFGARDPIRGVHGGQQALAERGLFAATGGAVPRGCRLDRRPRSRDVPERTQDATEMHPGERGQPHITGGFGLLDGEFQGGRAGLVITGLALGSSEAGQLVRLRLLKTQAPGRFRRPTQVQHGVVEPVLDAGQFADDRVAANVQPRVVDRSQPVLHLIDGFDAARLVTGGDRGAGGEEPVRGLVPRPVQSLVESVAAVGEFHRVSELAVMRHDVGEVVRTASLKVDVVDGVGQFGGRGDVLAGEVEVTDRRFDPGRDQQRACPVPVLAGVVGRGKRGQDPLRASAVTEDDPGPPEPT